MFIRLEGATEAFQIGHYRVLADKLSTDRAYREITAYDRLYDVINTDVALWYNELLPDADTTITLRAFRNSFFEYFGITQAEITLPNDNMAISRTILPSELGAQMVLNAILELNGCFGRMGRTGLFEYVFLEKKDVMLYPQDNLYPSDELYMVEEDNNTLNTQVCENCTYETYETALIDKLVIRQEDNDIGVISGEGADNVYVIQDNFLVYGKGTEELQGISDNIFNIIKTVSLRPVNVTAKGNLCFQAGDYIRLYSEDTIIDSYILNRTIKGLLALTDEYEASVKEYQEENVTSVRRQLIQLKGKSNLLEKSIEETKSTIKNVEEGLNTTIKQTADSIKTEASKTYETQENASSNYSKLNTAITQNAENINLKASKDSLIAEINLSAETATIKAAKIDLVGLVSATEFTSKFATIEKVAATYATITNLNSVKADVTELTAGTVNIATALNAAEGRIGTIEANYITAKEVTANYATINSLNAVEAKFGSINADNITAGTLSFSRLQSDGGSSAGWTHYSTVYDIEPEMESIQVYDGSYRNVVVGLNVTRLNMHYLGHA